MKYIDLTKPHGYLIWKGKQQALISPTLLPHNEKVMIIQEGQEAFGEVILSQPAQISLSEFERLEEEHATRPEERKLKWPELDKFYLYRFKEWYPYHDSRDVNLDNGNAELLPIIKLTDKEQKLLEQAERLPKTLILKDEAVILEDGRVIFCEGLDGSKVMPILQATLENKEVGDSLPLYQLALVRIPRLKLKKNMEGIMDDEKAEGLKPYKIVKGKDGCDGYSVVKEIDGKVMGCHDNEQEALDQMKDLNNESNSGGVEPRPAKNELVVASQDGQKCVPMEYIPYNITTFADLQAFEIAKETAETTNEVSQNFVLLTNNIMGNSDIVDKKNALSNLAIEMANLLKRLPSQKSEGYEEAVKSKSFSSWLDDYYELIGNPLIVSDGANAIWAAKFVNDLPDSSFLYIKPDCGDKDDTGKTTPRSCRMFPVKDSEGNPDLAHVRNAIARASQSNLAPEIQTKIQEDARKLLEKETKDEKSGRKIKKSMRQKLEEAWVTLKEMIDWSKPLEDEEEEEAVVGGWFKGNVGIKKVGNQYWYVTYSTNAFQDRENEIFSTKSLEKYVEEAEKKSDRGYFNLWHIPNTDFAEKKWQGVAGRFLIESGPFLDNQMGKAAFEFFKSFSDGHKDLAPEGWGCSPEYRYLPEERKTGVYDNVWITRTSTLPKMAAANIWTQGGMTMALTTEQEKAAKEIFGEELTKQIIKSAEDKTKELEEAGVAHKAIEDNTVNEDVIVEKLSQKMATDWEPIKDILEELVSNQKILESKIVNLENELSGARQEEAKKAKEESPKYVWRLFERASEAKKTIVAEGDPLKDKKPIEAPLGDKSGAAHFFGN